MSEKTAFGPLPFGSQQHHLVMIQDGRHLRRCRAFIDLNMVRAGVVDHPSEWEWTGYTELVGGRRRNRLIDTRTMRDAVELNGVDGLESFRRQYSERIDEVLASRSMEREFHVRMDWPELPGMARQCFFRQASSAFCPRFFRIAL